MKDSLRLFAPIVHDVVETADKKKMHYQKEYVLDDDVFKLRKAMPSLEIAMSVLIVVGC